MVKTVTAAENAINKLQVNTVSIEHSVTEVRAVIESQFDKLQAVVERARREVTEILEGEEKQALKQAEGIRVHLEQRCTELKKTQGQIEKLSKNKNDVDFLQVKPTRSSQRAGLHPVLTCISSAGPSTFSALPLAPHSFLKIPLFQCFFFSPTVYSGDTLVFTPVSIIRLQLITSDFVTALVNYSG
ncbi:tripartite motif-containing protein 16-like, partial [Plectropomus leopardus]|uniref:tripartite motif-containing protein 16-like n=1 Tax=Plectropomus leopardus TaxID=160734 RepID=UPI001C4A7D0F